MRALRIAIVGPESTGKTTLARALAQHYDTKWVPECAREYLANKKQTYVEKDLSVIARKQIQAEDAHIKQANRFLFCDTNLWVIRIWSEFKYDTCAPWIKISLKRRAYAHYFLTDIDMPWTYDPLRENPSLADRKALWTLYANYLSRQSTPYTRLSGPHEVRMARAISVLNETFKSPHA